MPQQAGNNRTEDGARRKDGGGDMEFPALARIGPVSLSIIPPHRTSRSDGQVGLAELPPLAFQLAGNCFRPDLRSRHVKFLADWAASASQIGSQDAVAEGS